MPRKLRSKGNEKSRIANFETVDLDNPAAENSEVVIVAVVNPDESDQH